MSNVKLPEHIKPLRYDLVIKPDLKNFTFTGEETIFLDIGKSVNQITLHCKELVIESAGIGIRNYEVGIRNVKYDIKSETAELSFTRNIPKGKAELKLKFRGILNDQMRGFYKSGYTHQGKQKHMAVTQFEATDARRAFPCFDEPAQKAVFEVTMIVPKHLTVISNTIESSIEEHPLPGPPPKGEGGLHEDNAGYKVVKFEPTPKMSTYLLAFIVGDFEYIEGRTRNHADSNAEKTGTLVRVFVNPGKKHQAKFALDTAIKCLEFYNEYFDIPYPLPVLDLIAIPDFSAGAMENWGAVTYRESALLVDPEHSSAANKQWVALVIAHELAHQWFGNLVTMKWWTHLWLNEGFASYIEYLATDHLFPKWDIWTQFAYHDFNPALELDSLKNTHPIEVEVGHPDEIGEIFDEISYSKGSSIIRMLAGYLGGKNFRDGLRYYLKKHAFSNASTVDLWKAFQKISNKPVGKIMGYWTGKSGYPVVRVIEEDKKLKLTQTRFFSSPLSKKQSNDTTLWPIPVSAASPKSPKPAVFLLSGKSTAIPKPKGAWVKLNMGETGFFRTDYPSQMLAALRGAVKAKKISAIDRLALVRDAFALSESGNLPTTQALEFAKAYENETDYTVWVNLASGLAEIRNLIFNPVFYPQFEAFGRKIFEKIARRLGWQAKKGESHTTGLLRSLILNQLISYNHQPTITKGLTIFKSKTTVPPDIRAAVYHAMAKSGSAKQHSNFLKRYKQENLSEEKNRIGRALGQFSNQKLLKKTLEFAMSKSVRIQDTASMFSAVWANPAGKAVAWQFTKANWEKLLKRYPSSGHMLSRFIKPAARFTSNYEAEQFAKFFKTHKAPGAKRALAQVLEKIYSNSAWLLRDGKHVESWLKTR